MKTLADDFRTWLHSGSLEADLALDLSERDYEVALAIRSAYAAGYQQCVDDTKAGLSEISASLDASLAKSGVRS